MCLLLNLSVMQAQEQPNMVLCEDTRVTLGQTKQQVRSALSMCCRIQQDGPRMLYVAREGANICSGSLWFEGENLVYAKRVFDAGSNATTPLPRGTADYLAGYAKQIQASAEALPERTIGDINGKREARLKAQAQIAEMYRQAAIQDAEARRMLAVKEAQSADAWTQALFQAVSILFPDHLRGDEMQHSPALVSWAAKGTWNNILVTVAGRTLDFAFFAGNDSQRVIFVFIGDPSVEN